MLVSSNLLYNLFSVWYRLGMVSVFSQIVDNFQRNLSFELVFSFGSIGIWL